MESREKLPEKENNNDTEREGGTGSRRSRRKRYGAGSPAFPSPSSPFLQEIHPVTVVLLRLDRDKAVQIRMRSRRDPKVPNALMRLDRLR
ncbi:hypothetical protein RUM44_009836 [Polyplax serrata]|uniref:Uncharacterized protein n=1 Tax=Polyplax serrata TaxID=468196 RepID=A0ABR1ATS9_POLSC